MSISKLTSALLIGFFFLSAFALFGNAQKASSTPRQEKLLNGLRVHVWNVPGVEKVSLRLRIHSGSAFDPQGKEGVMKLLSESFFPNNEAETYFADELGGSLEIISNYDYIQINAEAKASEFLPLLETVSQAVLNPDLSKEATEKLKAALAKSVDESDNDPAYVADRSAAKRLFGTFPYGRPVMGDAASIQKIDFADLRFARERLLTSDNATLSIQGVEPSLAFRAVRRYFGSWLKSDKAVPSTFRQPDAPSSEVARVELPGVKGSEVRYSVRGVARSSKEFAAAEVYERLLQVRFHEAVAKSGGTNASVAHNEHILPGAFVFKYSTQGAALPATTITSLWATPITESEFSQAKSQALASAGKREISDLWLDVDTFRLTSAADELKAFQKVSLADVNSLAARISREPLAAVLVTAPKSASPVN